MKYRLPSLQDEAVLTDYVQEHLRHGEKSITASLKLAETPFPVWVGNIRRNALEGNADWGKSLLFLCFEDARLIGLLQIRYGLSRELSEKYGQIGYGVRPSERGKGFATDMLRYALRVCGTLGMNSVLVGCYKDNLASDAVIRKCGGVLASENDNYQKGRLSRYYTLMTDRLSGNEAASVCTFDEECGIMPLEAE